MEEEVPEWVNSVPRLRNDLYTLKGLLEAGIPPLRLLRGVTVNQCIYSFVDTSGQGFGSTFKTKDVQDTPVEEGEAGQLYGVKIFMLGDNQMAEAKFYQGSSTNKFLHFEVLRLRKLEAKYSCRIHLVHCVGTHMIAQGTDGMSWGNMAEGVMKGANMMQFISLHRTASEASPLIQEWVHN
eukprot:12624724-Ditylum_brightwellii.AAC.1